eukprot:TRINITY_DN6809_c0_g1_i3.p1 TRINITY_DN6809_c0_g1~~TRINITY_DN6809_c0_g1_i3.p1  ORF type:complete len:194 (+),score=25.71 TRINITY_DN6809_c0_g1_i3:46-582(+)
MLSRIIQNSRQSNSMSGQGLKLILDQPQGRGIRNGGIVESVTMFGREGEEGSKGRKYTTYSSGEVMHRNDVFGNGVGMGMMGGLSVGKTNTTMVLGERLTPFLQRGMATKISKNELGARFNTFVLVQHLEENGFTHDQAKTLVHVLNEIATHNAENYRDTMGMRFIVWSLHCHGLSRE